MTNPEEHKIKNPKNYWGDSYEELEKELDKELRNELKKEFMGTAAVGADLLFKTGSMLIGKIASEDGDKMIKNISLTATKIYKAIREDNKANDSFSEEQAFELTKIILPQLIQQAR